MNQSSAWLTLLIAGLLEICWAVGLKYTMGFTRPIPSAFTVLAMILSMYLLGKAANILPIGTAYAIWVGIGAIGATIFGIILFHEPVSFLKIFFILLLVTSIIGLKFTW